MYLVEMEILKEWKMNKLIKDTKPEFMNHIIYSDIMRTYVVAGKPRKCIEIYKECIADPDFKIDPSHLSLVCIAMSHLIHCKTVDKKEKYQLYQEIKYFGT